MIKERAWLSLHVKVSMGKILNPKLLLMCWSAPCKTATSSVWMYVWITLSSLGQRHLLNIKWFRESLHYSRANRDCHLRRGKTDWQMWTVFVHSLHTFLATSYILCRQIWQNVNKQKNVHAVLSCRYKVYLYKILIVDFQVIATPRQSRRKESTENSLHIWQMWQIVASNSTMSSGLIMSTFTAWYPKNSVYINGAAQAFDDL